VLGSGLGLELGSGLGLPWGMLLSVPKVLKSLSTTGFKCRNRFVAITPGWRVRALTFVSLNSSARDLVNKILASFDCPYATHGLY
jgi:hypothetical protein